jgi:hypothetical protein
MLTDAFEEKMLEFLADFAGLSRGRVTSGKRLRQDLGIYDEDLYDLIYSAIPEHVGYCSLEDFSKLFQSESPLSWLVKTVTGKPKIDLNAHDMRVGQLIEIFRQAGSIRSV